VNLQLQVGAASEIVDVSAEVPLVDLETSSTGEVIQGRQVTELPLNGRNFTQLALLTPGVTRGDYGDQASGINNNVETFRNGETGGAALSINGLRAQANNFLLDGVDNNESLVNSINFFPPAEAIQEFRVSTSVAPRSSDVPVAASSRPRLSQAPTRSMDRLFGLSATARLMPTMPTSSRPKIQSPTRS
jgi:hypothetical protein